METLSLNLKATFLSFTIMAFFFIFIIKTDAAWFNEAFEQFVDFYGYNITLEELQKKTAKYQADKASTCEFNNENAISRHQKVRNDFFNLRKKFRPRFCLIYFPLFSFIFDLISNL